MPSKLEVLTSYVRNAEENMARGSSKVNTMTWEEILEDLRFEEELLDGGVADAILADMNKVRPN